MEFNGKKMSAYGSFTPAAVEDGAIGESLLWSSKNTVDKLCPAFAESGAAVRCDPVGGYPLHVVSEIAPSDEGCTGVTLQHMGKNLINMSGRATERNYYWNRNNGTYMGTELNHLAVKYDISIKHLQGLTISVNYACGVTNPNGSAGICFFDESKKFIMGTAESTFIVPSNAHYMKATFNYKCPSVDAVQFELGEAVTAFEPYAGMQEYTAEFGEIIFGGRYDWTTGELFITHDEELVETGTPTVRQIGGQQIVAKDGCNTLRSNTGDTEVSGRTDPRAVLERLESAIIALGGNV